MGGGDEASDPKPNHRGTCEGKPELGQDNSSSAGRFWKNLYESKKRRTGDFVSRLLQRPQQAWGHKEHHKHTPCKSLPCDQRGHISLTPKTQSNKVSLV